MQSCKVKRSNCKQYKLKCIQFLGSVDDVYVVPVSISYEKLIDGTFVEERLGVEKKFENFTATTKAIWSTLRSNFGTVRVDFSKPFSLKQFVAQATSTATAAATLAPIETTVNEKIALESATIPLLENECIACQGKQ